MSAQELSLVGIPPAQAWIERFTRYRPARAGAGSLLTVMRAWVARVCAAGVDRSPHSGGASVSWLDGHVRALLEAYRVATPDSRARSARAAQEIDDHLAAVLGISHSEVGLGGLVVVMARCWIDYADDPTDRKSTAQHIEAVRAYGRRVDTVSVLCLGRWGTDDRQ